MRNNPGFSIIALLILALGIGTNTAVFTVVNAVLLRELPYPQSSQLVVLHWKNKFGRLGDDLSVPAFRFLKDHARSFSNVALIDPANAGINMSSAGGSSYASALRASPGFFETLGVNAFVGRTFTETSGGAPAAVLSNGIWRREFGADPKLIGHLISFNGQNYTVSGIMQKDFHSYPSADVWVPLDINAIGDSGPAANQFRLVGRLKPGVSVEQAQRELDILADDFRSSYGLQNVRGNLGFLAEPYHEFIVSNLRDSLTILSISVFLVLLIACANLAALLLARGSARSQELAIRVALGAGRFSLFHLVMTETLVWSVIGGAIGLILARACVPLFIQISPSQIQRTSEISVDGSVALFTVLASILTALVCGLAPALSSMRIAPRGRLQNGTRNSAGRQQRSLARWLVSAQVAISTVLLAGAGLLLLTFLKTRTVTPGFVPERLSVFQVSLSGKDYQGTEQTQQLIERIVEKLQGLPAVSSVAAVTGIPTERGLNISARAPESGRQDNIPIEYRPITNDYFAAMGIPVRVGRTFTESDTSKSPAVVIVNESLARRWWPNQLPMGKTIAVEEDPQPGTAAHSERSRQVVAIVADVHEAGLDRPVPPVAYIPESQVPDAITGLVNKSFPLSFLVRSRVEQAPYNAIQEIVHSINPNLPIASLQPADEILHASLSNRKFYALIVGVFAAFAVFLTGVGLFGIMSFQVVQRMREIAIRMALGATKRSVLMLVIRQALVTVFIGLAIGLVGTIMVTKFIAGLLYNTNPRDPAALVISSLLTICVGFIASWLPAWRASALDPIKALRSQ
jgi:predicted permease